MSADVQRWAFTSDIANIRRCSQRTAAVARLARDGAYISDSIILQATTKVVAVLWDTNVGLRSACDVVPSIVNQRAAGDTVALGARVPTRTSRGEGSGVVSIDVIGEKLIEEGDSSMAM